VAVELLQGIGVALTNDGLHFVPDCAAKGLGGAVPDDYAPFASHDGSPCVQIVPG